MALLVALASVVTVSLTVIKDYGRDNDSDVIVGLESTSAESITILAANIGDKPGGLVVWASLNISIDGRGASYEISQASYLPLVVKPGDTGKLLLNSNDIIGPLKKFLINHRDLLKNDALENYIANKRSNCTLELLIKNSSGKEIAPAIETSCAPYLPILNAARTEAREQIKL